MPQILWFYKPVKLVECYLIVQNTHMINLRQFAELHRTFSGSEYGQELGKNVRYERYKPDSVSNKEWVELLGRDVSNLEHLRLTYDLTVAFVRHSEEHQPDLLDDTDKAALLLAGVSHDWGEALTGDISYGDKTLDDDEKERIAFAKVASDLFPADVDRFRRVQEVAFDHNGDGDRLGRIFSTIECLGYMRTALTAVDRLDLGDDSVQPVELQEGLEWLITDVLLNTTQKLVAQTKEYSAVDAAAYLNAE